MLKTPVVLLGHGSKNPATNVEFTRLKELISQIESERKVFLAYLQLQQPDLGSIIELLANQGETSVIIIPVFLFSGNHIQLDVPELIKSLELKFPKLRIHLGRHLGPDWRLADLIRERISEINLTDELGSQRDEKRERSGMPQMQDPGQIELRSFEIIERELAGLKERWKPAEWEIVKRVIHTTADPGLASSVEFHPQAIEAGIQALRSGVKIVTDVRMSLVGIGNRPAVKFGSQITCYIDDAEVASQATALGKTRAMMGISKACSGMDRGIVVIGNAPTALFQLAELIINGKARPDLIIGTPVGFVGAAESKEILKELDIPYIRTTGRRGGSTVAASIVNALCRLAERAG